MRIISAVVMIPATLAVVWLGGFVFSGFIALAALVVGWEWARLCSPNAKSNHGIALGLCLAIAMLLSSLGIYGLAFTSLMVGAGMVALLGRYLTPRSDALPPERGLAGARRRNLWVAVGAVYVGIPCIALVWLRNGLPDGDLQLLWLLLVVWVTDIGAFIVGRSIGGPKLAPHVSPGKTWAGSLGAVALCIGFGAMSAQFDPIWNTAWLAALAAGLSMLAQAGDLGESAAKRRFGVKDSGRLIPGHGGVLDRVDGLLAASIGYAAVCLLNSGSALTWQP